MTDARDMSKKEKYKRDAYFLFLKEYCTFADENSYIEVTLWANGEGFDVDIMSKYTHRF
ncbi:MAG: hypothetical protein WC389_16610 [Lutibacter sp.]|jgi:hypothetical protein